VSELIHVLKQLAILSYRYNTFRGKWNGMPDSTWLSSYWESCSPLPARSQSMSSMDYRRHWVSPVHGCLWLITADTSKSNKRLLLAMFLLTILPSCLMSLAGNGHPYIEIIAGMYVSANMLLLKTRQ